MVEREIEKAEGGKVKLLNLENVEAGSPEWTPFQSWLASLRALQEFDISFEWPEYSGQTIYDGSVDDWTRLLGKASWSRLAKCLENAPLTNLALGAGRFGKQGVLHFLASLANRQPSLRLIASSIMHHDSTDCFEILNWIANNLSLEYIDIEDLRTSTRKRCSETPDNSLTLIHVAKRWSLRTGITISRSVEPRTMSRSALLEQISENEFEEDVSSDMSNVSIHNYPDTLSDEEDSDSDAESETSGPP
ncbi:hypothetical protein LTR95_003723 [Oleoguttula sp. CCFEE 5521]